MIYSRNRTLVASAAALVLAAAVLGLAVSGAFARPAPAAESPTPEGAAESALRAGDESRTQRLATAPGPQMPEAPPAPPRAADPATELSPEVLELAVEEAPFEETRRAPGGRYRLPGEAVPSEPEPIELPPPPDFALLGAVSGGDGGFVVLRVDDDAPRMVAVGESVEGYTVASIEADRAVMEGMGRILDVPLVGASPTVEEDDNDDDDRRRERRWRDDDDDDDDPSEVQQEILDRARSALEQFQGQAGDAQVRVNEDGSITVVRPNGGAPGARGPIVVPRGRNGGSP